MKTRNTFTIVVLVLMLVIVTGGGSKKKPISDEELSESFSGIWINKGYDNDSRRAKIILFSDSTWERHKRIVTDEDEFGVCQGNNTILDKWIDSKGNLWFECRWECHTHHHVGHQLTKISDKGNVMEELRTGHISSRVEEWNPDDIRYDYRIWYRKSEKM